MVTWSWLEVESRRILPGDPSLCSSSLWILPVLRKEKDGGWEQQTSSAFLLLIVCVLFADALTVYRLVITPLEPVLNGGESLDRGQVCLVQIFRFWEINVTDTLFWKIPFSSASGRSVVTLYHHHLLRDERAYRRHATRGSKDERLSLHWQTGGWTCFVGMGGWSSSQEIREITIVSGRGLGYQFPTKSIKGGGGDRKCGSQGGARVTVTIFGTQWQQRALLFTCSVCVLQ